MREGIALEVNAAALPSRGQHAGGCGLDALMRIANHQFHATEAAPDEIVQELGPEGFSLSGADRHARYLAPAVHCPAGASEECCREGVSTPTASVTATDTIRPP